MDVAIRVDCRAWLGPLRRIWASIGYDEIDWTYTGRGRALYRTLRDLAETPYHVRNHNALTSGNGLSEPARGSTNVYQEAPDGSPVYDWTIVDHLYDVIVGAGFHPVVELGFLPQDLVPVTAAPADWWLDVGRETYEVDGLWKHPPRDFHRWEALVERFVAHCVDRYGACRGRSAGGSRCGTSRTSRTTGGGRSTTTAASTTTRWPGRCGRCHPSASGGRRPPGRRSPPRARSWSAFSSTACRATTRPRAGPAPASTSYPSTRRAPTTRPGGSTTGSGRSSAEHPSSGKMLRDIRAGLEAVAAVPALAGRPVVVDECDPAVGTIYGVHDNPSFVVTNSEYYPAFLCALVRRVLDLDRGFGDRVAFVTTWAFYMEGKHCVEGNRTLVTNENVEKPIPNGLRLLGRLGQDAGGDSVDGEPRRAGLGRARAGSRRASGPSTPLARPCSSGTRRTLGGKAERHGVAHDRGSAVQRPGDDPPLADRRPALERLRRMATPGEPGGSVPGPARAPASAPGSRALRSVTTHEEGPAGTVRAPFRSASLRSLAAGGDARPGLGIRVVPRDAPRVRIPGRPQDPAGRSPPCPAERGVVPVSAMLGAIRGVGRRRPPSTSHSGDREPVPRPSYGARRREISGQRRG